MDLRTLIRKYSDFFTYCVFGFLATVVNMGAYAILYGWLGMANVPSTVIAWFLAVSFAFVTNRQIVFRKKEGAVRHGIFMELGLFFSARAASGVLDVVIMYLAVDVMDWNPGLWKFISNLAMGLCNYIAGKFLIFPA